MKKIGVIVLLVIFILILAGLFFEIRRITGQNMEPALKNGQIVVFRKFLGTQNPNRGDIVLYRPRKQKNQDANVYLMSHVGRVVGLSTESIRIQNGNLYLDNNIEKFRIGEEYLLSGARTMAREENQWLKIGKFEYFILPDKRENVFSIPSNFVHRNNIEGVLFLKF